MKINRVYTGAGRSAFDGIAFENRKAPGNVNVCVPASWSAEASNTLAGKYLRRAGVPSETVKVVEDGIPIAFQRSVPAPDATFGSETDLRQVIHRLAGYWTYWGLRYGYFDSENAAAFYDEMSYQLVHQLSAPNSPQWFNTGLNWAYGITGDASGYVHADFHTGAIEASPDLYTHSAVFACHILSLEDSLIGNDGIFDWIKTEAAIFKLGAGAGVNVSTLRGTGEKLSGGGTSSGMMSFIDISDKAAGAIKSGGTTRRAAKLMCVDLDHPDVETFITWKARNEDKCAMIVAGSVALEKHFNAILKAAATHALPGDARFDPNANPQLNAAIGEAVTAAIPAAMIERAIGLARQGYTSVAIPVYTTDWESEAYSTVSGQNANLSVRIPNAFFTALDENKGWNLTERRSGNVAKTLDANELWNTIAFNAWQCADPGVQYDGLYNEWHTVPNEGRINATNPCSEYASVDNSSCNLASIRFTAFLNDDGTFDIARFEHTVELWTLTLEISVASGQLPAERLAANTWKLRNLGLGYADLGAIMMRLALAYDSDEARNLAGAVTALLTGKAYETSAKIAAELGAFEAFERNREPMLRVIRNHARAAGCSDLGDYEGLTVKPVSYAPMLETQAIWEAARSAWRSALDLGSVNGFRNSQVSVIAPAGTIGIVMDCDTTGVEPDFALVKSKQLAGGGYFRIVNHSVAIALRRLGYGQAQIREIEAYISGTMHLAGAPHINPDTLRAKGLSTETIARVDRQLAGTTMLDWAFTRAQIPDEEATALGYNGEGSILIHLGFTPTQISETQDHILGRGSIEGAPYIKPEHLPVFDCASAIGRSQRSIRPLAHVEMLAAVQPFVSGSISKTVNLPSSATIDDVKTVYRTAWEKMVKAVALYRDGSKLSQPLTAGAFTIAGSTSPTVPTAVIQVAERIVYRYIAQQRKLPDNRRGYTQKLVIAGQKFYLRTGEYDDGSLGEIFIDSHREGSTMRALLNQVAMLISMSLQYGVPLEELVEQFTFSRYEPHGIVEGDSHVKMCTSILDAIFRHLGIRYLGRTELAHIKPADVVDRPSPDVAFVNEVDGDGRYGALHHATHGNGHATVAATAVVPAALAAAVASATNGNGHVATVERLAPSDARAQGYTGNICHHCGGMRMVLRGTCEFCLDCAESEGACS